MNLLLIKKLVSGLEVRGMLPVQRVRGSGVMDSPGIQGA